MSSQPTCFPPVCTGSDLVLILGSFPGRLSLERDEYYGHPRNSFWPIMGRLLGFDAKIDYFGRIAHLKYHRIALWDALSSCSRDGSLDSSIQKSTKVVNDFDSFFENNRSIHTIFFNGSLAQSEFKKAIMTKPKILDRQLSLCRLPSTSPAMATLDFEQKLRAWTIVADALKETTEVRNH